MVADGASPASPASPVSPDRAARAARRGDVDAIAAALPLTHFGTSWGDRPTWKVPEGDKGRGFLIYRASRHDAIDPRTGEEYQDLLVIRVANPADKQALVDGPGPFFTIDHFNNYNAVLLSLSQVGSIGRDELAEVITEAWMAVAPKRVVAAYLAEEPGGAS